MNRLTIHITIFFLVLLSNKAFSIVYTTKAVGNINSALTWNVMPPATPNLTDTIIIKHNVTTTSNLTIYGTWIVNAGTTVDFTNYTIFISDHSRLIFNGTLLKVKIINNDGTFTVNNARIEIYDNLLNNSSNSVTNGTNGIIRLQNRAVNNAGGYITGNLNICRFDEVSDPILTNSGFVDWSTVTLCGTTLPIELVYIEAETTIEGVNISWATNTEDHSESFDVEKSSDGHKFNKIGNITSNEDNQYSFIDANKNHSTTYYRLKQYNTNGTTENSKIISVDAKSKEGIEIYPNPSTKNDKLCIKITQSSTNKSECNLLILNSIGDIIYKGSISANDVVSPETELSPGVYIIQISSDSGLIAERFVIK